MIETLVMMIFRLDQDIKKPAPKFEAGFFI